MKIMQNHAHLKHANSFPKGMGSGPKPIPLGNVVPYLKLHGEVARMLLRHTNTILVQQHYIYRNVNATESTLWKCPLT